MKRVGIYALFLLSGFILFGDGIRDESKVWQSFQGGYPCQVSSRMIVLININRPFLT